MKIKRIKKLKVNSNQFDIQWEPEKYGGGFDYQTNTLWFGLKEASQSEVFEIICHELWEICACEMYVRFRRQDCDTDYCFVYDHRQHTTMCAMFSGLLREFIV